MLEDYYQWLVGLLNDEYLTGSYQKLLRRMFDTEFTWDVEYDSNRASDGLLLRSEYSRQTHRVLSSDRGCNVLEMFIALCQRCENDLMYDPDLGDRTTYWFRMVINNLGLDTYDDYNYFEEHVDYILGKFMSRDYESDGFGCAFLCASFSPEFKRMDLWKQLNVYLNNIFPL